jgi:hypothetical protein
MRIIMVLRVWQNPLWPKRGRRALMRIKALFFAPPSA